MTQQRSSETALYPLLFEPIYEYRPWGGRRLADVLSVPLPGDGPIGEAWLLSDRDEHQSVIANGALKGKTLRDVMERHHVELLGELAGRFQRFPLLLKFLDAREALSVQVHPSDQQTAYLPAGDTGKTEGWVVLESGARGRIYAGLVSGTTGDNLRKAVSDGSVADHLASFSPKPGDSILIPAGTVHSFADLVVFEVQENSDVTFRLYDWDHIDGKTGKPRPLHVEQALACIDFEQGALAPGTPLVEERTPVLRERLFECKHFGVCRHNGEHAFTVGKAGMPRVVVCIAGEGQLNHADACCDFRKGDVVLLPASAGTCSCQPRGAVTLLEISLPEST